MFNRLYQKLPSKRIIPKSILLHVPAYRKYPDGCSQPHILKPEAVLEDLISFYRSSSWQPNACPSNKYSIMGPNKHRPIPHLAFPQLLHCLFDTLNAHRKGLDDRPYFVEGSELQHLVVHVPWGNQDALDAEAFEDDGNVRDGEVPARETERENRPTGCHGGKVYIPIWLRAGGNQEMVDLLNRQFLHALHRNEFCGS